MITYEYVCESCGLRREFRQSITEDLPVECPECRGKLQPVLSGGAGFVIKGGGTERQGADGCSLETSGKTCCGRDTRCAKPPCGSGA